MPNKYGSLYLFCSKAIAKINIFDRQPNKWAEQNNKTVLKYKQEAQRATHRAPEYNVPPF